MSTLKELLLQERKDYIWTKYCGYLDLSIQEYMKIQERLLVEQMALLHKSEIGRKLLGDKAPTSIEEFRRVVPLTSYEDYAPYLENCREDALPKGKWMWSRTSGRSSGENIFKWAPYSERMYVRLGEVAVGAMILASCTQKGEVTIDQGDVVLLATAPPPYVSGLLSHSTEDQGAFRFVPSLEAGEKMDFGARVSEGFKLARDTGLDYFYGLASVLAKIGERFESGPKNVQFSLDMLKPNTLSRMVRGMIKAKLARRALLPKDLWTLKGIMTGGTDTEIYRDKIEHYWGKKPLEGYACTEGGMIGMQQWNTKGMTFFPDSDFYEFIPFDEHIKNRDNPRYRPQTLRMDELEPGIYEIVFTNLQGGVFTRYRIGDLVEVIATRDDDLGIDLPQFRFYSRTGSLIDLAGFARLTESAIWKSIEAANLSYEEWTARKEDASGELFLHLYLEMKSPDGKPEEEIKEAIRDGLRINCAEFFDMEEMLGGGRLKVTKLAPGAFKRYMDEQVRAGADLAHIKPPHMQPSDATIKRLLRS